MGMCKDTVQTVEIYQQAANAPKLKTSVFTPWYEPSNSEVIAAANNKSAGVFGHCTASLLMKALYLARMVRLECAFTINHLAKYVAKWNSLCDKQLCHLFSYLANTINTSLNAVIDCRDIDHLTIEAYPDADLCGAQGSTRSTSGGFLCLTGKYGTYMPLEWFSKRQSATSHSASESALIAMSKIIRECLVPQMGLWSMLIGKNAPGIIHEDNQAAIVIANKRYSPQLRHLAKRHRISLGLVHEFVDHPDITLVHIDTNLQKGYILTKGL